MNESQQDLASVHSLEDCSMASNTLCNHKLHPDPLMMFPWSQKRYFLESLVLKNYFFSVQIFYPVAQIVARHATIPRI